MYIFVKHIFDFVAAIILAVLLSPLFLVIAILIKLDSPGSVFYLQERVGKNAKNFNIVKFRTMLRMEDSYNTQGEPLDNYNRITRVGKFLRRLSLDELPQLFNILKGEMSFIGPRPTLKYQVEKYSDRELERLNVRPGVSGWAQVNGRNSISWEKKIELDLFYVKNISLLLDLKILLKTVAVVLKREKTEFIHHDKFSEHGSDDWRDHINKKR